MMMERVNEIGLANGKSVGDGSFAVPKPFESLVQFYLRDITNRRFAGTFESESAALASLRGHPDGRFSINNHQGKWCEVEVRGGERYVRHVLMVDGSPAAFTKFDGRG
jgi:hypothetical protein